MAQFQMYRDDPSSYVQGPNLGNLADPYLQGLKAKMDKQQSDADLAAKAQAILLNQNKDARSSNQEYRDQGIYSEDRTKYALAAKEAKDQNFKNDYADALEKLSTMPPDIAKQQHDNVVVPGLMQKYGNGMEDYMQYGPSSVSLGNRQAIGPMARTTNDKAIQIEQMKADAMLGKVENKPIEYTNFLDKNGRLIQVPKMGVSAGTPTIDTGLQGTPPGQIKQKTLTGSERTNLTEQSGSLATTARLASSFKPEYAGYGSDFLGEADLWRKSHLGDDKSGQVPWWRDYKRDRIDVMHSLFGSRITDAEKRVYQEADISPGMTSKQITTNMARQQVAKADAIRKIRDSYIESGAYKPAEIDAILGYYTPPNGNKTSPQLGNSPLSPPQQAPAKVRPVSEIDSEIAALKDKMAADTIANKAKSTRDSAGAR